MIHFAKLFHAFVPTMALPGKQLSGGIALSVVIKYLAILVRKLCLLPSQKRYLLFLFFQVSILIIRPSTAIVVCKPFCCSTDVTCEPFCCSTDATCIRRQSSISLLEGHISLFFICSVVKWEAHLQESQQMFKNATYLIALAFMSLGTPDNF